MSKPKKVIESGVESLTPVKTKKGLFKSLADFQQEVGVIIKETSGYGYTYADLPAIFKEINPLLKKYNLGFTQIIDGIDLKTIIFHTETEEQITGSISIPQGVQLKGMNDFQVLGSAITYLRRYALSSMLGLVTDKDTDASGEQVGKVAPAIMASPVTTNKNPITKDLTIDPELGF